MDETREKKADPPRGIWHKIRRALALHQSFRRHQDHPMRRPAMTSARPPFNNVVENKQWVSGVVPIEYDRSVIVKHININNNGHVPIEGQAETSKLIKPEGGHAGEFLGKSSEPDDSMNERFSDYIRRAKLNMSKTSSDVGARPITRLESVNKKASAYIKRSNLRFKAATSGNGAAASFKKRDQK